MGAPTPDASPSRERHPLRVAGFFVLAALCSPLIIYAVLVLLFALLPGGLD